MSAGKPPRCWNGQEGWEEWNRLNVLAQDTKGKPLDHFCIDCTPEYQQRMQAEGRCEHPEVKFVRIVERQYDPRRHGRKEVKTDAMKGVRDAKS